jgi:hypothetical protein
VAGPKLLKWGTSGRGSNLLKSDRPLTSRTPGCSDDRRIARVKAADPSIKRIDELLVCLAVARVRAWAMGKNISSPKQSDRTGSLGA